MSTRWIFNVSEMLSRDRIESLLEEPGDRLGDRGVNARVYIVGGAAIASHKR